MIAKCGYEGCYTDLNSQRAMWALSLQYRALEGTLNMESKSPCSARGGRNLEAAGAVGHTPVVEPEPGIGPSDGQQVGPLRRRADGVELNGAKIVPRPHEGKHPPVRLRRLAPVHLPHCVHANHRRVSSKVLV
jgi:hypothetical protein